MSPGVHAAPIICSDAWYSSLKFAPMQSAEKKTGKRSIRTMVKRSPRRYSTESMLALPNCSCIGGTREVRRTDSITEEDLSLDPLLDLLETFQGKEGIADITKATWYAIAACALAASSAGHEVIRVYRFATAGLPLQTQKIIQRRIKEAIVKTSVLFGGPKAWQAMFPFFTSLKDEEIDHYGPRWSSIQDNTHAALLRPKARQIKGIDFFSDLWGEDAARENLEFSFKFCPDLFVQNVMHLEWFLSEDAILKPHETCMCTAAAIICSNCPLQAMWHTRGIVRQGGTIYQAKFAQHMALGIAELFGARTGKIQPVEEIDFDDESFNP